jgi:NAD(P)-dependent dehydrogenase (short-subunit alcohol dehydrogenase family)
MTSLKIEDSDIADFSGRTCIITGKHALTAIAIAHVGLVVNITTGGASGIGLATAQILAAHGSFVHVLDRVGAHEDDVDHVHMDHIIFHRCNVASWTELRAAFNRIGPVHVAIANAGVSQTKDHFVDELDAEGLVREPEYAELDVNLTAVLHFVKLSLSSFRQHGIIGGSIVLTSSATGLFPEQSIPVYSACKAGLLGLVRALRASLPHTHAATINAVAPAATFTGLLSEHFAAPLRAAGMPVSTAHHVGLAVAWSADARQQGHVEAYGKDEPDVLDRPGRWNGRVILTMGDTYTEVEEALVILRPAWAGRSQCAMTARQQALTDFRPAQPPPELSLLTDQNPS